MRLHKNLLLAVVDALDKIFNEIYMRIESLPIFLNLKKDGVLATENLLQKHFTKLSDGKGYTTKLQKQKTTTQETTYGRLLQYGWCLRATNCPSGVILKTPLLEELKAVLTNCKAKENLENLFQIG